MKDRKNTLSLMSKYKYTEGYKNNILEKFLQVGDVPCSWNRPSFQSGQAVGVLSGLPSDFVGAPNFPLLGFFMLPKVLRRTRSPIFNSRGLTCLL